MLKIKRNTKYILSSVGLILAGLAVTAGSIKSLSNASGAFAESGSVLPECTGIEVYSDKTNYVTADSPISLDDDTVASYVVPDQTTACTFNLSLNGHDLTGVGDTHVISIGANVVMNLNGGSGHIKQIASPDYIHNLGALGPAAVEVGAGGIAAIYNISITPEIGPSLGNYGAVTLTNVLSSTGDIWGFADSGLVVESGAYNNIYSKNGETLMISGGTIRSVTVTDDVVTTIDGGIFERARISNTSTLGIPGMPLMPTTTNNITVNGGEFADAEFESPVVVDGGTFVKTQFAEKSILSGGIFDTKPDDKYIPEGKKAVENEDGTYSIIDDDKPVEPDEPSDPSGPDDSGETGGGSDGGETTEVVTIIYYPSQSSGYYYDMYRSTEPSTPSTTSTDEKKSEVMKVSTTKSNTKTKTVGGTTAAPNVPDTGNTNEKSDGSTVVIATIIVADGIALAVCSCIIYNIIKKKNSRDEF